MYECDNCHKLVKSSDWDVHSACPHCGHRIYVRRNVMFKTLKLMVEIDDHGFRSRNIVVLDLHTGEKKVLENVTMDDAIEACNQTGFNICGVDKGTIYMSREVK